MVSPSQLRVAVVQMNSQDDVQRNVATALRLIDQAAGTGARLVALPEVWPYLGPDEGSFAAAEPIPGPLTETLAKAARRHGIYLHAGSIYEQITDASANGRKMANTTVVFNPAGEIIATYRKIHLFDVSVSETDTYRESDTIVPGEDVVVADVDGIPVGLAICYDLRFSELFRLLALRGAEIMMVPAAFTLATGRDHWEVLLRARAIENGSFVVAPGQVGVHPPGKACFGRSMIVDPWGTVLAQAPDVETVIAADLDLTRVRTVRRQIPSLANRRPDVYAAASRESPAEVAS